MTINFKAISFALIFIILSIYVFTGTVREKKPNWILNTEDEITSTHVSGDGGSLVFGTSSGKIFYHLSFNSKPFWEYQADARITSLKISLDGRYLAATDEKGNLYCIFQGNAGKPMPLLKINLREDSRVSDIFSGGGTTALVRILVTSKEKVSLFDKNRESPMWSISLKGAKAKLSQNGKYVIIFSDKKLSFFSSSKGELIWERKFLFKIIDASISRSGDYMAVATSNGEIHLLHEGKTLWSHNIEEEIKSLSLRAKGREVMVVGEEIKIFSNNGELLISHDVKDEALIYFPPYGSYLIVSDGEGISLYYGKRKIPVWRYSGIEERRFLESSLGGEYIFSFSKDSVNLFFSNSVFLIGSRNAWALVFGVGILEIFIFTYRGKKLSLDFLKGGEFFSFLLGGIFGAILGRYLGEAPFESSFFLLVGLFSGGFAGRNAWKSEGGFIGLFVGFGLGLIASLFTGVLVGCFLWVSESESFIIAMILRFGISGISLGLKTSPLGAFCGVFLRFIYTLRGGRLA
ncbi:MAG: PQQ-binding-like beta-propeller repeat protein [Candidatus Methanofastidiosia archaeon]